MLRAHIRLHTVLFKDVKTSGLFSTFVCDRQCVLYLQQLPTRYKPATETCQLVKRNLNQTYNLIKLYFFSHKLYSTFNSIFCNVKSMLVISQKIRIMFLSQNVYLTGKNITLKETSSSYVLYLFT